MPTWLLQFCLWERKQLEPVQPKGELPAFYCQKILKDWSLGSSLRTGCIRVMLSACYLFCPACRGRDRGASAVSPTHSTALPLQGAGLSPGWHRNRAGEPYVRHTTAWAVLLRSGLAGVLLSLAAAQAPGWAGSDLPVTLLGKITNPVDLEGANSHHSPFPPDPIPKTCF